jgi:hypothetical protein
MSKGKKFDNEKPPITIIPKEAIYEMAKAFQYGAGKYGRNNFKGGIEFTRLADATMRHLLEFINGEDFDKESSNNHLGHALASLAMLAYMYHNKKEMDDRYKPPEEDNG